MRILVISDIHNDIENIIGYLDKLMDLSFDVVVVPGDFTNYSFPKGFTTVDITKLIIEDLRVLGKPILAVPGNWDKDVVRFLDDEGISIHGKGKIIKNVGFYGYGGAHTPFNTPLEPSEEEIKNGLERAYKDVEATKIKVQVTHIPPIDTKLDLASTGVHIGSVVVRTFIENIQPKVAICAHVHEARGVDGIKNTKIVNAGRFPEGHCGLIDLGEKEVSAEIISLI